MSMTIGELIAALKRASPNSPVYYDFASCVPTVVRSWRGSYNEPALGWDTTGYSATIASAKPPTAKELIAALELATNGRTYTGWKGGEYAYTTKHQLHIDNAGDCTNTEIVGVDLSPYEDGMIVLRTEYER